jgi:hypothetical protein
MTEEEHTEDREDLTAEIARLQQALRIAGMNIVERNEERGKLMAALTSATLMIDQLIGDLVATGAGPSIALRAAKSEFDADMKKLLGKDRPFQRLDEKPRSN